MRFRKLQIAWSVFCGVACVLLVALWMRSQKTCDLLSTRDADGWTKTTLCSSHGTLEFYRARDDVAGSPNGWTYARIDDCNPPTQSFRFKFASAWKLIQIPDWLPLMFCTASAIGPWLRWRFSIRTILIATTLIALALSWICYVSR
jgi:hypothetical protein